MTPDRYDVVAPFDPAGLPEHMCRDEECETHTAPVGTCCPDCPGWGVPR
jgi:hypothetical protein